MLLISISIFLIILGAANSYTWYLHGKVDGWKETEAIIKKHFDSIQ